MSSPLVLASRNHKKIAELQGILDECGLAVRSLDEFPEIGDIAETGTTFAENAAIKAETVLQQTGQPAMADDSGLMVSGLDPLPGIHSARFAELYAKTTPLTGQTQDERNNELLLARLEGRPAADRTAWYCCVIAVALPGQSVAFFEGRCDGIILEEPRGEGGFGYDPLFYSTDLEMTFAEAPPEAKRRVSHRARAMEAMRTALQNNHCQIRTGE